MGWVGHSQYELNGGEVLWFPGSLVSIIMLVSVRCISDTGLRHFERVSPICFDCRIM